MSVNYAHCTITSKEKIVVTRQQVLIRVSEAVLRVQRMSLSRSSGLFSSDGRGEDGASVLLSQLDRRDSAHHHDLLLPGGAAVQPDSGNLPSFCPAEPSHHGVTLWIYFKPFTEIIYTQINVSCSFIYSVVSGHLIIEGWMFMDDFQAVVVMRNLPSADWTPRIISACLDLQRCSQEKDIRM